MKELEEVDMARKEVLESEARLRKGVEIVRMNLREEEVGIAMLPSLG